MIDKEKIPQRIYIKDFQLAECETEGVADARINATPYKGGNGNLCEYININFLWHKANEEPEEHKFIITQWLHEGEICYETDRKQHKVDWQNHVAENNIIQWCYIEDLLPKGGDK